MTQVTHRQGCDALGGYGHGIGPCTCGATVSAPPAAAAGESLRKLLKDCRDIIEWHGNDGDDCGKLARHAIQRIDAMLAASPSSPKEPVQMAASPVNAPLTDERAAFEASWGAITGRQWLERADEAGRGDRATYSEVWTRRAWLLWKSAREVGVSTAPAVSAAPAAQPEHDTAGVRVTSPLSEELRSLIEGMSVSVDVGTGPNGEERRYFGTIAEVMDCPDDKHGVTLLVQDAEPNWKDQT